MEHLTTRNFENCLDDDVFNQFYLRYYYTVDKIDLTRIAFVCSVAEQIR